MQKKLSKILGILGSVLLLSQPLVQVQTAGAATTDSPVKSVATGKKQLENQLRSASSKRKEQINQKYFNAVKDQLAARGADVSNLNLEQVKDQPVKVIVELKSQPAFKENIIPTGSNTSVQQIDQASNQVINQQSETKKQVENITGTKVRRKYGYLFNGFSIMAKPSQIAQIKKVNGVKNVSIAKVYYPQDNSANELANVQKVWESNHFKGEGMVIAILDTGIDPTHKDLRISEPSKEKISVNQGNNLAKTLGYGKACNDKVPFAYNYADGTDQTVWDTGTTMHGMHVAGIAAANGEGDDPINAAKGVAPEAQLLDLKVFSNTSKGATSDDLISAIEDSVKLGADIMNMSLGSTAGDVDSKDPEQIAIVNATKQGVIPVISAGNSGLSNSAKGDNVPFYKTADTATVGSPGVSPEAITVASAENSTLITNVTKIVDDKNQDIIGRPIVGQLSKTAKFEDVSGHAFYIAKNGKDGLPGIGNPEDFDGGVKGKIAVVARGAIAFTAKQKNAKAAGAVGLVIVDNNPNNSNQGFAWLEDFPTLGVTTSDGKDLVKAITAAPDKTYKITVSKQQVPNKDQGKMSTFTSFGPNSNLSFKPDVTAPGGQIWSMANGNKYQNMSGTSMAAPFIAGATAIMVESLQKEGIQLSKDQLTKFAKISLMNTAKPMLNLSDNGNVVSPRQQGSGMIQLDKAVDNRVTATTPEGDAAFALKEIGVSTQMTVTLNNRSNKQIKYTFNNHGGPWTSSDELNKAIGEVQIAGASLTTDKGVIVVPANGRVKVTVNLSLPMNLEKQKFVEGYIGFDSETAPNLVVPYLGFYGNWDQVQTIDKPAFEDESVFGGGYFQDKDGNILGSDLPADQRGDQNNAPDFSSDTNRLKSYIKPDTVAISPNDDGHQDDAYPTYYLFKNCRNPLFEIYNEQGKSVKILYKDTYLRKSFYDANGGNFTTVSDTQLGWNGKAWDKAKGKELPVTDGVYTYRFKVGGELNNEITQSQDLKIRVDTQKPKIGEVKLTKDGNDYYLKVNLSDENSGLENMGTVEVSVNGISHEYSLNDPDGKPLSTQPFTIKLVPEQSANLQAGKNLVEVGVLDNAANFGYQESYLVAPGKSERGLIVYNIQNGMTISSTTPDVDAKNNFITVKGSYDHDFYLNGQPIKVDKDGMFNAKVLIPKDGVFRFSDDSKGFKLINNFSTVIAMKIAPLVIKDANQTIRTDQKTYELTGTVDPAIEKILIKGPNKNIEVQKIDFEKDHTFKVGLDLVYGINEFTITAKDKDGNVTDPIKVTIITSYDDDPGKQVIFDDDEIDIGENKLINTETKDFNPEDGSYTITGHLKKPVATFKIAGENVDYNPYNLKFSKKVKLPANGYKSIWVYVADEKGKALVDGSIHFSIDTTLPTLKLENSDSWKVDEKGDYHLSTLQRPFVIRGTAGDNYSGFMVFINNNLVAVTPMQEVFSVQNGFPVDFSYEVIPAPGINQYEVTLIDMAGNKVTKRLIVNYLGTD